MREKIKNMLLNNYKEVYKSGKWKYYEELHFKNNPFEDKDVADSFIYTYFKTGCKESVLEKAIPEDGLRNIHSISAFFLGFILKPIINIPESAPSFNYFWFLTCLYHDYGYYIENDKIKYNPSLYTLGKIKKKFKIKHNLINDQLNSIYDQETILNYYTYCQKELKFLNHGIIGGLLLFDRLLKNFETNFIKAQIEAKENNKSINKEDFIFKKLHWSSLHKEYYRTIAKSILEHNIWSSYDDLSEKKYFENKLGKLIINNKLENRIDCANNPFLFLLLLADTIEPIKHFNQIQPLCVLKKVNIEVDKIIRISILDDCLCYKSWFDKFYDLEKWLKIKVTPSNIRPELVIEIQ